MFEGRIDLFLVAGEREPGLDSGKFGTVGAKIGR
jgi:hypothetical protein